MLARTVMTLNTKIPKSIPMETIAGTWMDLIVSYIKERIVLTGKYSRIDGVLYWKGYTLPLLWCLNEKEIDYVLREIHQEIYRNHSGARSLAFKTRGKDISDLICIRMHRRKLEVARAVRTLLTSRYSDQKTLLWRIHHCHLLNGNWYD